MDGSVLQTYLSDVLHVIAQALLAPDIILLIAFIAYALFCIGSIVAERFSERRHFKVVMPKFLAALMEADEESVPEVIRNSGLLKRQKKALLTVFDYRVLPGDALVALIKRLVDEEETRYDRITGRNNMAARVSPMLGLMGTLIPLGPGIEALGRADTTALSSSLLIAFDTTVAGLVVAAVCLIVGKIRGNWYGNYMSALDSAMATMLQKIEDMRAEGKIETKEPSSYAFMFEENIKTAPDFAKGQPDEAAGNLASAKADQPAPAAAEGTGAGTQAVPQAEQSVPQAGQTLSLSDLIVPPSPAEPDLGAAAASSAPFGGVASAAAAAAEANVQAFGASQPAQAVEAAAGQSGWGQPEQAGWKSVQLPGQEGQAPSFGSFVASAGATFEPVPMPSFLDSLASAAVANPAPAADYAAGAAAVADPAFGAAASAPSPAQQQFAYQPAAQQAPAAQAAQAKLQPQVTPQAASGWYQPPAYSDPERPYGSAQGLEPFDPYGQR